MGDERGDGILARGAIDRTGESALEGAVLAAVCLVGVDKMFAGEGVMRGISGRTFVVVVDTAAE